MTEIDGDVDRVASLEVLCEPDRDKEMDRESSRVSETVTDEVADTVAIGENDFDLEIEGGLCVIVELIDTMLEKDCESDR